MATARKAKQIKTLGLFPEVFEEFSELRRMKEAEVGFSLSWNDFIKFVSKHMRECMAANGKKKAS